MFALSGVTSACLGTQTKRGRRGKILGPRRLLRREQRPPRNDTTTL
jgi:hypothetical protein